jgi:hypothetical protein
MNKWISVDINNPAYPNGGLYIKENNYALTPIAVIPFPLGNCAKGIERQIKNAKLMVSSPENFERMRDLSLVVNEIIKECAAAVDHSGKSDKEHLSNIIGLIDNKRVCKLIGDISAVIEEVEK